MLSSGQQQALDELRFITEAGDSIELIQHRRSRGRLVVELSIDTKFPHEANGIAFRPRELFNVESRRTSRGRSQAFGWCTGVGRSGPM